MPLRVSCQRCCYHSTLVLHGNLPYPPSTTPFRRPWQLTTKTNAANGSCIVRGASMQNLSGSMLSGTRLTGVAHEAWQDFVQRGDTVVDATAGNGGDTVWLAKAIGPHGKLYAFDTQAKALATTRAAIDAKVGQEDIPEIVYAHRCHSTMQEIVAEQSASLICFNLGYLPSADDKDSTSTKHNTTVSAVAAALKCISKRGLVSLLAYTGHPGGQQEYAAVRRQLLDLSPASWTITEHKYINRPTAPILILIVAKKPM